MKKVLVIGANGFLAKHLIEECIKISIHVDCVINQHITHIKDILPPKSIIYNIRELENITDVYDVIFFTASYIPYGNMNMADTKMLEAHIQLPYRVVQHFRKSRIVYTSSVSVYRPTSDIIDENSQIGSNNLYGLSKYGGEIIFKFHPNVIILRLSSIYGSGMTSKTFIPQLIQRAKESKNINIYGTGERQQNYIYVKDAVQLCLKAAISDKTGVFLGVNDKSNSNLEVAKAITDIIPQTKINLLGEDNSPSGFYNGNKSKTELSFVPLWDIQNGLKDMING